MEKRRHFWLKVIWFLGHFVLPAVISFNKVFPLPLSCSPPPICVLHACKCVYACVHEHSCGDQHRMLGVILCRFYCITVRWGFLSFWWTGWLARCLDPSVFAPWYGRGPGMHRYAQLLPGCLGFELSGLQSGHSVPLSHLPSLMVSFDMLCRNHDVCHYQCIHTGF